MANNVVERPNDLQHRYIQWAGMSTESKPTSGIATGSLALEIDTAKVYAFNESDSTWYVIAELGGGS